METMFIYPPSELGYHDVVTINGRCKGICDNWDLLGSLATKRRAALDVCFFDVTLIMFICTCTHRRRRVFWNASITCIRNSPNVQLYVFFSHRLWLFSLLFLVALLQLDIWRQRGSHRPIHRAYNRTDPGSIGRTRAVQTDAGRSGSRV